MNFDDFDKSMRIYETLNDQFILPGVYMVVRLDGRGFHKLTRDLKFEFETPFDIRFNTYMIETVIHLMKNSGFNFVYGYTQSDEISLLMNINDNTFSRKARKINSVLAGEASAKFTLQLGSIASFDSRICQLPAASLVQDYFEWRQLDASRNALNSWCYWTLRKSGLSARKATSELERVSVSGKNELLFRHGINFNDLPLWQKRGVGFSWELKEKEGYDPKHNIKVTTLRRSINIQRELPMGLDYRKYCIQPLIYNM